MKSIEAVDATTVKFTMCAPDPAFPSKVAFSSLGIHSAAQLEKTGGRPLEDALGTGPYKVKEWIRGDQLVLEANPEYWGEAPKTPTVIFKWNPEATARFTALRAGEVDAIDNPDPNDFEAASTDSFCFDLRVGKAHLTLLLVCRLCLVCVTHILLLS